MQADSGNVLETTRRTTGQLDQITRKAASAGQSIKKAFSLDSLKSSLSAIPGMEFLMNPYTMVAAGVGAIASIGAEAEKTSVAFKVLVGDETKAVSLLGDINNFAAKTPFSKLNLESAAQTMLNFGVSSDNVMSRLKMLGDISMGDAQKLSSLSLVYGQVEAAGKLQGQDLLQFINAGWNPLKELQAMTGKSYQDLQNAMSKGQISADMIGKAMEHATSVGGQFHGMMEATSQTFSGKMSTAIGMVQQRVAEMYTKLQPLFMTALDGLSAISGIILDVADIAVSAVGGIIKIFKRWHTEIGYIATVLGVAIAVLNAYKVGLAAYVVVMNGVAIATRAWAAMLQLVNFVMQANPIGLVIIGVTALTASIVYCWNKFAGFRAFLLTMWDTMKGFGNIIKNYVIDRLVGLLVGIKGVGSALAKLFKGDFAGAWGAAKGAAGNLLGLNAGKNALSSTRNLVNGIHGNYGQHLRQEEREQGRKGAQSRQAQITTPGLKGSTDISLSGSHGTGGASKGGKAGTHGKKSAESIATGGTRNTSINVHIAKFFDNIQVTMADKADTAELQRIVVETMNRALAIATSTDR